MVSLSLNELIVFMMILEYFTSAAPLTNMD